MFPACLDVRDLQGVTDRLDRTDRRAVRGSEHSADTQGQLVAGWGDGTERKDNKVSSRRGGSRPLNLMICTSSGGLKTVEQVYSLDVIGQCGVWH